MITGLSSPGVNLFLPTKDSAAEDGAAGDGTMSCGSVVPTGAALAVTACVVAWNAGSTAGAAVGEGGDEDGVELLAAAVWDEADAVVEADRMDSCALGRSACIVSQRRSSVTGSTLGVESCSTQGVPGPLASATLKNCSFATVIL